MRKWPVASQNGHNLHNSEIIYWPWISLAVPLAIDNQLIIEVWLNGLYPNARSWSLRSDIKTSQPFSVQSKSLWCYKQGEPQQKSPPYWMSILLSSWCALINLPIVQCKPQSRGRDSQVPTCHCTMQTPVGVTPSSNMPTGQFKVMLMMCHISKLSGFS